MCVMAEREIVTSVMTVLQLLSRSCTHLVRYVSNGWIYWSMSLEAAVRREIALELASRRSFRQRIWAVKISLGLYGRPPSDVWMKRLHGLSARSFSWNRSRETVLDPWMKRKTTDDGRRGFQHEPKEQESIRHLAVSSYRSNFITQPAREAEKRSLRVLVSTVRQSLRQPFH